MTIHRNRSCVLIQLTSLMREFSETEGLSEQEKSLALFCSILFHQQSLESEGCLHPHNLTVPSYRVDWLEPFALFDFTVTPYTYWGKAPVTSVALRAPEGGTKILNLVMSTGSSSMSASETLEKDEQLSELVSCRQSCKDMFLRIFGNYLLQT